MPTEIVAAARTAISIEPRDSHLCVFVPPLESVDDYVDLVGAIEDGAARPAGAAGGLHAAA